MMTVMNKFQNGVKGSRKFILLISLLFMFHPGSALADDSSNVTFKSAWGLYNEKQYKQSADAFEVLIKKHRPSPKLYYYAAHANFSAGRRARSRQLSRYVVEHFGSSKLAPNCIKMFPELVQFTKKAQVDDSNKDVAVVTTTVPGGKTASVKKRKKKFMVASTNMQRGGRPFTAASIAKDGAAGIDQQVNPNCWFEASMAALAELPRGQRLLANMIRYGDQNSYIVRFPGDGVEYKITKEELRKRRISDKALWASLIECAQVMKFPNNRGADGASGRESRLAIGLGCITGCRAELLYPRNASIQQMSSFIGAAVRSKNPIVCGTYADSTLAAYPPLVIGAHAYTIIDFNPASKMVTVRNPHGESSRRFSLKGPNHRMFEQKDDGVFKMHLQLFQKYFWQVCRSNI